MAKRLKGTREVLVDQAGEITLVANNHIADIAKLYKNYEISFDIFPTGTFPDWDNILHITNGMVTKFPIFCFLVSKLGFRFIAFFTLAR